MREKEIYIYIYVESEKTLKQEESRSQPQPMNVASKRPDLVLVDASGQPLIVDIAVAHCPYHGDVFDCLEQA